MSGYDNYGDRPRNDMARITKWTLFGVVLVAAVSLLWVYVVSPLLISRNAENLQRTYGAQSAKIDAAREAITAATVATNQASKKALTIQACHLIADVNNPPADLASFEATDC